MGLIYPTVARSDKNDYTGSEYFHNFRRRNLNTKPIVTALVCILLFSLIYLVPPIEPFRSGKALAKEIDRLIEPSEDLVFYLKARDTFLFYTDRKAAVLKTPKALQQYMASEKQVYCIFKMDDWQDVQMLHETMHIVALAGNKLIVSNKKLD